MFASCEMLVFRPRWSPSLLAFVPPRRPPSLLLFLLLLTLSSRFPPAMSDMPPLRDFLQAVFARIKAGGTGDSELAVWRNTARELVDRTIGVSSGCAAHSVG